MEPQFRYARRQDGARTAYAVYGRGPVLLVPPGFLSNIEWAFEDRNFNRKFWDAIAARRTVVLYDRHGCGLSDRKRTEFTADDDMLDLYAVVDALGAPQLDIFGMSFGGLVAVRFAAEQPGRVRRLVLWGTTAMHDRTRFPEELRKQSEALSLLRRSDSDMFLRMMTAKLFPSGVDREDFQSFVKQNQVTAAIETMEQLEAIVFDNLGLLKDVQTPALVIHRRGDRMVPFEAGQYLARRLPNARFTPLDGDEHLPAYGDTQTALRLILDFLDEDAPAEEADDPVPSTAGSGMAVILFTDIADSTGLTERMGDAAFRGAARTLDERLRAAIREAGGVTVEGKTLGDGVLATFASASQAILAARRCLELSGESELRLHVGLHAGDVIREDDNVYGGAVNVAARICGLSSPGEILVSGTIRDLARTSAGAKFEDRGEHALKGIEEPVRLFSVVGG